MVDHEVVEPRDGLDDLEQRGGIVTSLLGADEVWRERQDGPVVTAGEEPVGPRDVVVDGAHL